MTFSSRPALIVAMAGAIALTSIDVRPAAAAPARAAITQNAGDMEFSAARKGRHRGRSAFPLAAFGSIVGTIVGIAAAEHRRAVYEQQYYAPYGYYGAPYAYGAPVYGPPLAPAYGYSGWYGD